VVFCYAAALVLVGLGIYIGGWVMLVGGLTDTVNFFKTSYPVTAADVAIALAKILFASPVGWMIVGVAFEMADDGTKTWEESREKRPRFVKDDDGDPAQSRAHPDGPA